MLALCDFITPNETEAETLTGLPVTNARQAEPRRRCADGAGRGGGGGDAGRQWGAVSRRRGQVHVPVISAGPVVETTGAGDAFNGGFAVALSEGRDVIEAVRFRLRPRRGFSVTRRGATAAMPARAEIDALLARG
jgi:ribokinase